MARTIGDLNQVWTRFSLGCPREHPPTKGDPKSLINPYFGRMASTFQEHFGREIGRIDALKQEAELPGPVENAFYRWHDAVVSATGQNFLPV